MTKIRSWAGTVLVFTIVAAINGPALSEGNVARGEQLARRWCSSCHLVAADQLQASADVPPFSVIARMPNFTPEKVAFFLLDPHPKMPNLALSRQEADDIAAYIGSLR
jgi:mono/diheme cytochrome c family protein